ncbi:MAG: hypothetical protein WCP69_12660 [Bacteroidota bacterium]
MSNIIKFQSSKVTIYDDKLTYKKFFKAPITIKYDDLKNMIATCFLDGDKYRFDFRFYNEKWHLMSFNSFDLAEQFEILSYLHLTVSPILLPKLMARFDEGNDIDFGFLILNKNSGIIKTNNVKRTIKWSQIKLFEFWGGNSARIKFSVEDKEDIFEFTYDNGNVKKETFLFNVFEQMIGIHKMKGLKIENNSFVNKFVRFINEIR